MDNTLIHSYKKANEKDICVEELEGRSISFMTFKAYNLLKFISQKVLLVPVTTRSIEQFKRIRLPVNTSKSYAITTNGANLLINGEVDKEWQDESFSILGESIYELSRLKEKIEDIIAVEIRIVDGFFLFFKHKNPNEVIPLFSQLVDSENFVIDTLKEKIYIIPVNINKGEALLRFIHKMGIAKSLCAGDSLLDIPMLLKADVSYVPKDYPYKHEGFICADRDNFSEFILENVITHF